MLLNNLHLGFLNRLNILKIINQIGQTLRSKQGLKKGQPAGFVLIVDHNAQLFTALLNRLLRVHDPCGCLVNLLLKGLELGLQLFVLLSQLLHAKLGLIES